MITATGMPFLAGTCRALLKGGGKVGGAWCGGNQSAIKANANSKFDSRDFTSIVKLNGAMKRLIGRMERLVLERAYIVIFHLWAND